MDTWRWTGEITEAGAANAVAPRAGNGGNAHRNDHQPPRNRSLPPLWSTMPPPPRRQRMEAKRWLSAPPPRWTKNMNAEKQCRRDANSCRSRRSHSPPTRSSEERRAVERSRGGIRWEPAQVRETPVPRPGWRATRSGRGWTRRDSTATATMAAGEDADTSFPLLNSVLGWAVL